MQSFGRRPRFSVSKPMSSEATLQITSMADIFTIILVFLLKSFTSSTLNVTPSPGMELPQSIGGSPPVDALMVEISETGVLIDNELVSELKAFRFKGKDLDGNGLPRDLESTFTRQRKRQQLIAKSNPDVQPDSKILVMADRRVPYLTLKSVISTAALHGYHDLKLVVVKQE